MATTRITFDQIVDFGAKQYLQIKSPGLNEEKKARLMPKARYDFLTHALHTGVAMVVSALALTLFAKFAAAAVIGGIGVAIYSLLVRPILKYQEPEGVDQVVVNAANAFLGRREQNPAANVLQKLGLPANPDWTPTRLVVCNFPVIMNYSPEFPQEVPVAPQRVEHPPRDANGAAEHPEDAPRPIQRQRRREEHPADPPLEEVVGRPARNLFARLAGAVIQRAGQAAAEQ